MTEKKIEELALNYDYDHIVFNNREKSVFPAILVNTPYYGFYLVAKRVGRIVSQTEYGFSYISDSGQVSNIDPITAFSQTERIPVSNNLRKSQWIPKTLKLVNLLEEFILIQNSKQFSVEKIKLCRKINELVKKIESGKKPVNPCRYLDNRLARKWCRVLRLFSFLQMPTVDVKSLYSPRRDMQICLKRGINQGDLRRIEFRARFQKMIKKEQVGKMILLAEDWENRCLEGQINADPHQYERMTLSYMDTDTSFKMGYEWLLMLIRRFPENIDFLKWQARYLRREDKIEQALQICEKILSIHPSDFETHCFQSNLYYIEKKFILAQKSAMFATSCNKNSPVGYISLAFSYLYNAQYDEAISAFDQAIELDPLSVDALRGKSKALVMKGNGYQAMNCLVSAVRILPDDAELYRELADVYFMSGYIEECRKYCKKSLSIDPNLSGAYVLLGMLEIREGKTDYATKWLNRSLEIDPDNPIALNELAYVEHVMGNDDECLRLLEKALHIAPDFSDVVCSMGVVYYFKGEYDVAHSLLDRALELDPFHVGAMVTKGNTFLAQSMADEALTCYEKALEMDPEFIDAVRGKADALRALGLEEEAMEWFAREKEINDDDNFE